MNGDRIRIDLVILVGISFLLYIGLVLPLSGQPYGPVVAGAVFFVFVVVPILAILRGGISPRVKQSLKKMFIQLPVTLGVPILVLILTLLFLGIAELFWT